MDYLRIDEDGTLTQVKGKDPEDDSELLQEVANGTVAVLRYRGNQFEQLEVEEIEGEDGEDSDFDCTWNAVDE